MKIGSLFSGIGGLELGLERAGVGHTVWQCEQNPAAQAVLRRHWPGIPVYGDVRTLHAWHKANTAIEKEVQVEAPAVDVICGGFP